MAFLSPTFANDIFLSYARVDNAPLPGEKEGWVDLFRKTLEIELSRLLGEGGVINVWMDTERLESNQLFDPKIEEQIRQSGVFLALTSRGSLRPGGYCRRELALFHSKANTPPETPSVGTRSRIFNALLYNAPFAGWPGEFGGTSGARLYDDSRTRLGDPSRVGGELFNAQVKELAEDIYALLTEYRELLDPPPPDPEPQPPVDAHTVFLADTVAELDEVRDSVAEKLTREGFSVVERMPPPWPPVHDPEAVKAISAAALSVHLLGATPGRTLISKDSAETFLQRQAGLGVEHAKSQYVWVPQSPIVEISSVQPVGYKTLLEELEGRECDEERYTFARVGESELPDEILRHVRRLTAPKPAASAAAAAAAAKPALLETHRKDQLYAINLSPHLLDRASPLYVNQEKEDDPGENLERLQLLAREVRFLVIVFCNVTTDWVSKRLESCLQAASTVTPPRLKACGIYSPPDEGEKGRLASLRVPICDIPIIYSTEPSNLFSKIDEFL